MNGTHGTHTDGGRLSAAPGSGAAGYDDATAAALLEAGAVSSGSCRARSATPRTSRWTSWD
ncbi:hypothetical protein AB0D84_04555 [Streptomyces sp. NPDC048193]|uniref:hypothetical protein n=1 Tax=Streptomyces sp. NPDC048193 TaxID=3155630 RepID=UPI00343A55BA